MFYFSVCNYDPNAHIERGKNVLIGPHKTRDEAKVKKANFSTKEYERSDIFEASNKDEAEKMMEGFLKKDFNRL